MDQFNLVNEPRPEFEKDCMHNRNQTFKGKTDAPQGLVRRHRWTRISGKKVFREQRKFARVAGEKLHANRSPNVG